MKSDDTKGVQQGLELDQAPAPKRPAKAVGARKGTALHTLQQRTNQVIEKQSKKLKAWADEIREAPNELLRSALFSAGNKNRRREHIKNAEIATYGNCKILYSGEELRQDDLDVWLEIIHAARDQDLDQPIYFNPHDMKKELRYPYGTKHTERLMTNLTRLKATAVTLHSERLERGLSLSLIRKFEYSDDSDDMATSKDAMWYVELEPEIAILFGGGVYSTRIEKEQRMSLSGNLAKWLHGFYASHKEPYPVHYHTLLTNAGSRCATAGKAKQLIKSALDELKACGFLKDWRMDKAGKVEVERNRFLAITQD
ncbi:plasmid replication initiator TrfA [Pseudomonas asiatica]|uniref:plasmid replication initiator TrfA n=1 Tax=Pseudomonas TaxID=286 RepID=UPI001BB0BC0F|nr:plasmid replication initiator TrfA [Pseudomonas putida]QUG93256.1 TrfA family protein [Pseudomonas putida]